MPFDGATYDPKKDFRRLETQLGQVYRLMIDGVWRTLPEIRVHVKGSESAISARLRDLRKDKFGGYRMESRRRTDSDDGLWEYRVVLEPLETMGVLGGSLGEMEPNDSVKVEMKFEATEPMPHRDLPGQQELFA